MKKLAFIFLWLAFLPLIGGSVFLPLSVSSSSPITASISTTRTGTGGDTCVAPCAVFFDASATTDPTVTSVPLHELRYSWDFGDSAGSPVSGTTWAYGARATVSSRNAANGPEAAHVFENVGTFTVTLTVYDGTNTNTATVDITATDPDTYYSGTNTICYSNSGSAFTGCPSGATHASATTTLTGVLAGIGTGKRLLLNRGDTFTTGTSSYITADGPWQIGAYGTGAKPIIQATTGGLQMLKLGDRTNPALQDFTLMDLDFDGNSTSSEGLSQYDGNVGQVDNQLVLRCDFHDMGTAMSWSNEILDYWNTNGHAGHALWDGLFIVDVTGQHILGGAGKYNLYVAANHLAVLGSSLDNSSTGSHTVRVLATQHAAFSDNTIQGGTGAYDLFKMHAYFWGTAGVANPGGVGTYTEKVVIFGNKFIEAGEQLTIGIGPEDSAEDERVRDVIFDSNWLVGHSGADAMYWAMSASTTIRNNLFDVSLMNTKEPITLLRRGAGQVTPDKIWVYNNTFYSSSTDNDFAAINISVVTNAKIKNNIAYAPNDSQHIMISGTGGTGYSASNNSTNTQVGSTSPNFVSATPSAPADFQPNTGSYAIAAGASIPVWQDFFAATRSGTADLGAINH